MNTFDLIEFCEEGIQMSKDVLPQAIKEYNYSLVCLNYNSIISDYLDIALLKWREGREPILWMKAMVNTVCEATSTLATLASDKIRGDEIDVFNSIYAAYLVGMNHPPVNLGVVDDHILARAFFGNVLIGAADIADWPKYRDALPRVRRTELARRTNELYADLLAGRIAPDIGVKLGEKFWEERENNEWFLDGGEGGGDDNHRLVDYQLGAILKKIGSTVPTVHAWVW